MKFAFFKISLKSTQFTSKDVQLNNYFRSHKLSWDLKGKYVSVIYRT